MLWEGAIETLIVRASRFAACTGLVWLCNLVHLLLPLSFRFFWVDVLGLADTSVREIPSPLSTALATSCSFD